MNEWICGRAPRSKMKHKKLTDCYLDIFNSEYASCHDASAYILSALFSLFEEMKEFYVIFFCSLLRKRACVCLCVLLLLTLLYFCCCRCCHYFCYCSVRMDHMLTLHNHKLFIRISAPAATNLCSLRLCSVIHLLFIYCDVLILAR